MYVAAGVPAGDESRLWGRIAQLGECKGNCIREGELRSLGRQLVESDRAKRRSEVAGHTVVLADVTWVPGDAERRECRVGGT